MLGLFLDEKWDLPYSNLDKIFLSMDDPRNFGDITISYGDPGYAMQILKNYGEFCITLTPETNAQGLQETLKDHPGTLYCRCSATPVSNGTSASIGILENIVDVWMPVLDTEDTIKEMYSQFPRISGKIWPIFNVDIPYIYAQIYDNFVLYNYHSSEQLPNVMSYINLLKGRKTMSYPTNNKGLIANYLSVDQFQPNHSEFECGAYAVSVNLRATNYNEQNTKDPAKVVEWANAEYAKVTGSNTANNTLGVSIDAMHVMLKDTQKDSSGGLHYWDMPISGSTKQSDDISRIKTAIQHGYAVIATVLETSVYDMDLGRNPYWWGPKGNHIITYAGIGSDGNLLCIDTANVPVGDLQKPGTVLPQPRRYEASRLANQWATIIQFPWLPDIPSNDPLTWGEYQPPKVVNEPITMFYDPNGKQIIYMVGNTAIYRIQL